MEIGLYYDLDFKEYRKIKDWVSTSELSVYRKAGLCYKYEILDGHKRDTSPQQMLGTYLHTAFLEPEEWKSKFLIGPKIDKRTKEGKALHAERELLERSKGITFIEPETHNIIENAAHVLNDHPFIKHLKADFKCEASMFWKHGNVKCKGRVDAFSEKHNTIFDLKTTRDAKNFGKSILDYGYHRQAAYYLDGLNAVTKGNYTTFIWFAIEIEPPFLCAIYQADPNLITVGRMEYEQDLLHFSESQAKNEWSGLDTDVQMISLPSWYLNRTTEMKT